MKEYRYSGPANGVTLSDGTEILLWSGRTVFLPEGHGYVKVLMALKYLMPEPEDTRPIVTSVVQSSGRRSSSDSEVKTGDAHDS